MFMVPRGAVIAKLHDQPLPDRPSSSAFATASNKLEQVRRVLREHIGDVSVASTALRVRDARDHASEKRCRDPPTEEDRASIRIGLRMVFQRGRPCSELSWLPYLDSFQSGISVCCLDVAAIVEVCRCHSYDDSDRCTSRAKRARSAADAMVKAT